MVQGGEKSPLKSDLCKSCLSCLSECVGALGSLIHQGCRVAGEVIALWALKKSQGEWRETGTWLRIREMNPLLHLCATCLL